MIDDRRFQMLEKNLIKISNVKNFLIDIPTLHPDSPKYQKLWSDYMRHCIEGFWGVDSNGYRFMPPTLFFYGNFFRILHIDEEEKVREVIKPIVRDIDWEIHYSYIEAQGFSGFKDDDEVTCDFRALSKDVEVSNKTLHLFNSQGKLKKFVHPRTYLRTIQKQSLGRPLYTNAAKNLMIFGSRGGGKSYTVAGLSSQTLSFDGIKAYTRKMLEKPPTASVCIGAGNTEKSSDLISKVVFGLNAFGVDQDLGVWGNPDLLT